LSGHQVGNDRVKGSVFSTFQNVASIDDDMTKGFKPFQLLEATIGKAWSLSYLDVK